MNKNQKEDLVLGLKEKLQNKNFVLAGFNGLSVAEISDLRSQLRKADCSANVVKNRLLLLALKDLQIEGYEEFLKNVTLLAIQNESESFEALKVLKNYAKANEKFFIKAGQIAGKYADANEVSKIADLPSREVLLAQLLSRMNAPISNLVYALNGNISNIVYVLDAIKNQKEKQN